MSVMMSLRVQADPKKVEAWAKANHDAMMAIVEQAKSHGAIAHRFYGTDDGHVMVLDEWPDAASFQRFFEAVGSQIQPMMIAGGATSEPEVTFWNMLDTGDDIGWGA